MKISTSKASDAIVSFTDFYGSLRGKNVDGLPEADYGWLLGKDKEQFIADSSRIRYIVYSYFTPIAWYARGKWYKVKQKFSVTTSKHQGQLYLIKEERSE